LKRNGIKPTLKVVNDYVSYALEFDHEVAGCYFKPLLDEEEMILFKSAIMKECIFPNNNINKRL